jgi:hypothetical protein
VDARYGGVDSGAFPGHSGCVPVLLISVIRAKQAGMAEQDETRNCGSGTDTNTVKSSALPCALVYSSVPSLWLPPCACSSSALRQSEKGTQ